MRRSDFELVAEAMNDAKPRVGCPGFDGRIHQWNVGVDYLTRAFEHQSPGHFDRDRFLKNCGMTDLPSRS
jgi:hypothetical protein